MALFAVIAPGENEALSAAVERGFPSAFYKVAPGQFLISEPSLTTQQLSEKLEIGQGTVGRVLIVSVQNYTGWHSKDMWEWVSSRDKLEKAPQPRSPDAS